MTNNIQFSSVCGIDIANVCNASLQSFLRGRCF